MGAEPMASPADTTVLTEPAGPDAQGLLERLQANRKVLTGAGVALALLVLVGWFMVESGRRREAAASGLLESAWSLQDQGNLPQASTELQRVIDSYGGTDAAMQATLALNQVRLESGQAQIAADALRAFVAGNPAAEYAAAAHRLLGVALENLGQPAEAAAAYQAAATAALTGPLKAEALLSAARAWRSAGNSEEALRALRTILTDHKDEAVAAEATVRLAELTKGAM